jgi:PAS domain S-box-containing protein
LNSSQLELPLTPPQPASLAGPSPTWRVRMAALLRRRLHGLRRPGSRPEADAGYRAVFHALPQPAWVFEPNTLRVLDVNEAAVARYGYARGEFLRISVEQLAPEPDRQRLRQALGAAQAARAPAQVEGCWTHVYKDGRRLDVELRCSALQLHGGPACMMLADQLSSARRLQRELAASMAAESRAHAELQQVMARIGDAFMALDGQGRFTHANARAALLLGLDAGADLVGRTLPELLPNPGAALLAERVAAATRHGRVDRSEQCLADQGPWCELRIFPAGDGVTVYASDISAQRKARDALRESERQFRMLAERLPAMIYRAPFDPGAPCTYISPAIGLLGYTPQQWMSSAGPNWPQVIHPDDRERVDGEIAAAAAAGAAVDLAYRMRDHKGQWRHVIDHCRFVVHGDGRPELQGVMVEVTELRRTEQALREAEAYQRGLFEAMAEGVLLLDSDQRIVEINHALARLSGYAAVELMRMTVGDLLEPVANLSGEAGPALPPPAEGALAERELRRKDGGFVPVEVSVRPVGQGGSVLVLRDVTDRRKAERAIRSHKAELSGLTSRLLTQERETTRYIAQTLHDHLGQHLALARLHLDASMAVHAGSMSEAMHRDWLEFGRSLDRAMADVRAVLHELRPALLEEQGLIAALDNEVRARTVDTTQPDVLLELDDGDLGLRWPAEVEYAAFMIAREAIVNAQQRQGTTLVRVVLAGDAQGLQLEIIDDGRAGTGPLQAPPIGHVGLVGMRERALSIGGQFAAEYSAELGNSLMLLWLEAGP